MLMPAIAKTSKSTKKPARASKPVDEQAWPYAECLAKLRNENKKTARKYGIIAARLEPAPKYSSCFLRAGRH